MDSQHQQFCLKWNSFSSNLATSFSNLFKSEALADVTLFCEGVTFKAHKLILAACSKHLADLFETASLHQTLMVILDGISASNMAALLEFMYKGEVHVSQDALSSFLKAAECLQVKGLSIEHEKLAVAQTQSQRPQDAHQHPMDGNNRAVESPTRNKTFKEDPDQSVHHQSSPSPTYSPKMSPYMSHHYRPYERISNNCQQYDNTNKHNLSPSEIIEARASVLRDGKRPVSPAPMPMQYRPASSSSNVPENENVPNNSDAYENHDRAQAMICPESSHDSYRCRNADCAEDLRMKMEPSAAAVQQDEPPSSTAGNNVTPEVTPSSRNNHATSPNNIEYPSIKYDYDRDKTDLIPTTLWNTVTGKLSHHKQATVNTPDGKKLKCPFCERLYGYETNLRAHIRQRHQGIRVPCPFCSRTFTRNNTVRRHIAREHKTELSLKAFHTQQQQAQQVQLNP